MAASEVDLPDPVAPTKMTKPRLLMTTSLRTGGRPNPSIVGRVEGITRKTIPILPCCTKALTRKRPIPVGATAKLHSRVLSNSAACLSFITARARAMVCAELRGCGDTLVILPSIFMPGGKSALINRSEPPRASKSFRRSLMNFVA